MKILYKKIKKDKEETKIKIQKILTELRNIINERKKKFNWKLINNILTFFLRIIYLKKVNTVKQNLFLVQ